MQKTSTFYTKRASYSLILLWIGAMGLLITMLYNWQAEADNNDIKNALLKPKGIFVDDLLLSSQDLQLGESVGLINISLNRNEAVSSLNTDESPAGNTSPERKLVYSKMLKNKIKNISSGPVSSGVIIKPLPQ